MAVETRDSVGFHRNIIMNNVEAVLCVTLKSFFSWNLAPGLTFPVPIVTNVTNVLSQLSQITVIYVIYIQSVLEQGEVGEEDLARLVGEI